MGWPRATPVGARIAARQVWCGSLAQCVNVGLLRIRLRDLLAYGFRHIQFANLGFALLHLTHNELGIFLRQHVLVAGVLNESNACYGDDIGAGAFFTQRQQRRVFF